MIRIIALFLYSPLLLLFYFSDKKEIIIVDLYARSDYKQTNLYFISLDLALKLFRDKYFRTLFYFRTSSLMSKFLRIFYARERYFIIDVNTKLGKGVRLAHPYSTILNAECIGDNLYVNHLVTVGEKDGRRPIIGNDVELHTGSIIIGNISIGNNVIVGAGAVVVKSVPDNCIVVGNPARIIKGLTN